MIERVANFLGQQRLDIPHLRSMESSVAHDFDVLAGNMLAGKQALVLKGFNLTTLGAVGAPATALRLNVAGGLLIHYNGSESGSMFSVAETHSQEVLSSTNAILSGSFTSNTTNYLGLDLSRSADDTTSDSVQFLPAGSSSEVSRIVPLARTLKYRLVLTTQDFSSRPTVLPLAKIVTDASNFVVSIADARQLMFRLGAGGDFPSSQTAYLWPQTRLENYSGDIFSGGDKAIGSMKEWMDAMMARLQEIGGGEFWFSATADRNVNMVWHGTAFSNGEMLEWTGTNLHWQGLRFVFDNSTSFSNLVQDQAGSSAGLTDLALDECVYVDLDRTRFCAPDWVGATGYVVGDVVGNNNLAYECITAGTSDGAGGPTGTAADITDNTAHWKYLGVSAAALVAFKGQLSTLGPSAVPGARQIIAWRIGNDVFTRNRPLPVGTAAPVATTTSDGLVRLNATPLSSTHPQVVTIGAHGTALIAAPSVNAGADGYNCLTLTGGNSSFAGGNGGTGVFSTGGNGTAGTNVGGAGGTFIGGDGTVGGSGIFVIAGTGAGALGIEVGTGDVQIPAANIYKFASAINDVAHVHPMDTMDVNTVPSATLVVSPSGVWKKRAEEAWILYARFKVPAGATLTGMKMNFAKVTNDVTVDNIYVVVQTYAAGTTYTQAASYSAASITVNSATPQWWTPTGAWTNRTVTDGDSFVYVMAKVNASAAGAPDSACDFFGARLTYTYYAVKPGV